MLLKLVLASVDPATSAVAGGYSYNSARYAEA